MGSEVGGGGLIDSYIDFMVGSMSLCSSQTVL